MLGDDPEGGMGMGESEKEPTSVYIELIPFIVQQKPTQQCQALIHQQK